MIFFILADTDTDILYPRVPSGPFRLKKFKKTLILAFEANRALSHENETKIVKITHSEVVSDGGGGARGEKFHIHE